MRESFWGYWIIILGVFVVVIMMLISNVTTTNTQDYYLIKEVSESAMLDAVDYGYYRASGELRINAEKFVESFIRRFSDSVSLNTYQIDFYGIYEAPPKASVKVTTKSGTYSVGTNAASFDIVNRVDSILEVDGTVTGTNIKPTPKEDENLPTGPVTPGTSDPGVTPVTPGECVTTVDGVDTSLNGMSGVSLVSGASASILNTYGGTSIGTAVPGEIFTIYGEKDHYWAIDYKGQCGWVDSDYMAINLKQYIPNMSFRITNYEGSIYKSSGYDLPNVTGMQLYTSEYASFVPANYPFAKKLKRAANSTSRTLVVYDAYRPYAVTQRLSQAITQLRANSVVKNNMDYSYGASGTRYAWLNASGNNCWFLACNLSAHNTANAVDITFADATMPTQMHELSTAAVKYYSPSVSHTAANYSKEMTPDAIELDNIMKAAGLDDLASEWWHFQCTSCNNKIKSVASQGATFWSNV